MMMLLSALKHNLKTNLLSSYIHSLVFHACNSLYDIVAGHNCINTNTHYDVIVTSRLAKNI